MTPQPEPAHPFDKALQLTPIDSSAGLYHGATSPDYWNMVGPFGGVTAAIVVQAVLRHPQLQGSPIAVTVNYAAAIAAGTFEVQATPVRTNRSSQHWTVQVTQPDAQGTPQINTTATVVTATRRETWGTSDVHMPKVPHPKMLESATWPAHLGWLSRYDMRLVHGAMPTQWNGEGTHSESLLWMRDAARRPLDLPSLMAMSDMFYPRVWLRRAKLVPAGTVSLTTYIHADAAQLVDIGSGYLLGRAQGQGFRNGFFDHAAHFWSPSGVLLATSHQIVYYKE